MPGPFLLQVVPVVDNSKIESTVNKPLEKSASTFEQSINNTTSEALKITKITSSTLSTFSALDFGGPKETSLFKKIATNAGLGAGVGAAVGAPFGGPIGAGSGALVGGLSGIALTVADDYFETQEILSQINFANIEISKGEFLKNPALKDKLVQLAKDSIFGRTNAEIANFALAKEKDLGKVLGAEGFLELEFPVESLLFKDERFEKIDEIMNRLRGNVVGLNDEQGKLDQTTDKLNQTTEQTNQLNQEQINIQKQNAQATLEQANNQSTASTNTQQLTESVKASGQELANQAVQLQQADETLGNLGTTAENVTSQTDDLNGNAEDLADTMKDSKKQFAQAEKTVGKFDGTAGDATKTLEQTNGAAEQLGENGLPKIAEGAEEAQKALSDIDLGKLAENFSAEQIAGLTGLPIEDIIAQAEKLGIVLKQDVADGVKNVEEEQEYRLAA